MPGNAHITPNRAGPLGSAANASGAASASASAPAPATASASASASAPTSAAAATASTAASASASAPASPSTPASAGGPDARSNTNHPTNSQANIKADAPRLQGRTPTAATLLVSGREFITLSNFDAWDGRDTCEALLQVQAGDFACLGRTLYFDNLSQFVTQLRNAHHQLTGVAELRPDQEDTGWLRIEFGRAGEVTVRGLIVQNYPPEGRLEYSFECDQSFVPPFIAQLEQVLRELQGRPTTSEPA